MAARKTRSKKKAAGGALTRRGEGAGLPALPQDLMDEFAGFATRDKATATQAGWPWVQMQGATAQMRLSGEPIGEDDQSLLAVILGGNQCNMYYEGAYEPGVFRPPTCYAVASTLWERGEVDAKIAPPGDLKTKQSDRCKDCKWNAFGTADRGRGKACKNTVRLAMLPAYGDGKLQQRFDKVDGVMLSIPPTSLKAWTLYVNHVVEGLKRPVCSVVTRVRKVPNETGAGFKLSFEIVEPIQDAPTLRQIASRVKGDGREALEQAPPSGEADGGEGGGGKAPQRRKKVVRRTRRERAAARS